MSKPGPRKSWAFIYRRGAKTTELGLGGLSDASVVTARAEATALREVLSQGGDPRAHRERKRQEKALEDARTITFETAARRYHERRRSAPTRRHSPRIRIFDSGAQFEGSPLPPYLPGPKSTQRVPLASNR